MSFVHRRVFYAKIGKADSLVEHLKEGENLMGSGKIKTRLLTDFQSGRSDRVVMEWEVESFGDIDAEMSKLGEDAAIRAKFEVWEPRLNELIHYSEVDNLMIR